jgi:hypothetical protein
MLAEHLERVKFRAWFDGLCGGCDIGWAKGRRVAVERLLVFKFKLQTLDEIYWDRLFNATSEEIDRYLERVLTADSLAAVFED